MRRTSTEGNIFRLISEILRSGVVAKETARIWVAWKNPQKTLLSPFTWAFLTTEQAPRPSSPRICRSSGLISLTFTPLIKSPCWLILTPWASNSTSFSSILTEDERSCELPGSASASVNGDLLPARGCASMLAIPGWLILYNACYRVGSSTLTFVVVDYINNWFDLHGSEWCPPR